MGRYKSKELLVINTINNEIIGILKESFDIYISLKRELDLYENILTNCKIDNKKEIYTMKIPKLSDIKIPNLGNTLIQIRDGTGFKEETLSNFTKFFLENSCIF